MNGSQNAASLIAWILGAAAVFTLSHIGYSAEGELHGVFKDRQRRCIDENALWSEREKHNEARVEAYGSVLHWLVARTPLPVTEEISRAAKLHREVLANYEESGVSDDVLSIRNRLVGALPPRMKSNDFDFSVVAVNSDDRLSFAVGGGRMYVSRAFLESANHGSEEQASDQIAFVLAHEMGHMCLGHVRRLYQRQWLHEQLENDLKAAPQAKEDAQRFLDNLRGIGVILEYAYSREDDFHADLFAAHLCRNAGFDVENGMDVLRRQAVEGNPALLNEGPPRSGLPPVEPEVQEAVTGESFTLAEPPAARHRLRRLRLELDGRVYGSDYGIFEWDRKDGDLQRARDGSVDVGERAVICIHGMESDLRAYRPMMQRLAETEEAGDIRILGFRYPADESLARNGRFLMREMQRVCADAKKIDFVCHSAGGLVFRHYAEVGGGGFHRTYFQGTPHRGSNLAALRSLLEVGQFIGDLDLGYDRALANAIRDGHGQMSHDLLPDSLFLAHLNAPRENLPRDRYVIYRGRALSRARVFFVKAAVAAAARSISSKLEQTANDNTAVKFARSALAALQVPAEIIDGDLCVTVSSAALEGVDQVYDRRLNHTELPRDPATVKDVIMAIVRE